MRYKVAVCLLICAVILCLSGCTEAEISCGIQEDCSAFLSVRVATDLGDMSETNRAHVINSFERLAKYYEDTLGYTVEKNLDSAQDTAELSMSLKREADTYEDAFEELKKMLTDETLTLFTEVDLSCLAEEFQHGYAIKGKVNPEKVIQKTDFSAYGSDLETFFQESIQNSSLKLVVKLPAAEVVEHTGSVKCEDGFAVAVNEVPMEKETELVLVTKAGSGEGAPDKRTEDILEELEQRDSQIFRILLCAAGALLLSFVLLLAALVRRKKSRG